MKDQRGTLVTWWVRSEIVESGAAQNAKESSCMALRSILTYRNYKESTRRGNVLRQIYH